jgi:hypothetical protein
MPRTTYVETVLDDPGTYLIEVEEVRYEEWRPSRKAPLARRIVFALRVVSGEHEGERIYHEIPFMDDLLFILKRTLRALGEEVDGQWTFEYEDATGHVTEPHLVGRRAKATVTRRGDFVRVRLAPIKPAVSAPIS